VGIGDNEKSSGDSALHCNCNSERYD
jgi:hypothetical protein